MLEDHQAIEASVGLLLTKDFCAYGMWKYVTLGSQELKNCSKLTTETLEQGLKYVQS